MCVGRRNWRPEQPGRCRGVGESARARLSRPHLLPAHCLPRTRAHPLKVGERGGLKKCPTSYDYVKLAEILGISYVKRDLATHPLARAHETAEVEVVAERVVARVPVALHQPEESRRAAEL